MSEEQQVPVIPEKQSDVVNINSENMQEFYNEKLGLPNESSESVEAGESAEEQQESDPVLELDAEPEHKEEKPEKPKKKNSFQERISELTAKEKAAIARAEAREAEAAQLRQELETLKKPAQQEQASEPTLKKPDINTYTDVAQYEADLTAYNREMFQAELRAQEAAKAQLQLEQTWEQKKEAFKAEVPDYEDTIAASNLMISDVVKEAIVESDIGPQLAYHLATNPEIAAHLRTLSLASQAREIGKIEAGLAKAPSAAEARPTAQASKAPAPISPIKGGAITADNKVDANGEFMGTPDEYKALRKAGKIK